MKFPKFALLIVFTIISAKLFSQPEFKKAGNININEIKDIKCDFDEKFNAFYLDEIGEATIYYNDKIYLYNKYYSLIKVETEKGLEKANYEILLFKSGTRRESVEKVIAYSYTPDNTGVYRKTKLKEDDTFTEVIDENYSLYKFAVPNVKVGSYIEVYYEQRSDFVYALDPWKFQSDVPKLKSEYRAIFPANFDYRGRLIGSYKLSNKEQKIISRGGSFGYGSSGSKSDITFNSYTIENIRSFKKEAYLSSEENYISQVKFELNSFTSYSGIKQNFTKSWENVDNELLHDERFGDQIDKKIFKDELKIFKKKDKNIDNAIEIFEFVKGKIAFNGYNRLKSSKKGIKDAINKASGNSADINLTLINLLERSGYDVKPVILPTRNKGYFYATLPSMADFNYVIAQLNLNGTHYLLDATEKNMSFGYLPFKCYNLRGRIVSKEGSWLSIDTQDANIISSFAKVDLSDNLDITVDVSTNYTKHKAFNFRNSIDKYNSVDDFVANFEENNNLILDDYEIKGRDDLTSPINFRYTYDSRLEGISKPNEIRINPIILNSITKNPFTLSVREYPIDFGIPTITKTTIQFKLPEGYKLNKDIKYRLSLPDNMGEFIYSVSQNFNNDLMVTTKMNIKSKVYPKTKYEELKKFYNSVIALNKDMITLEKISL